MRTREHRRSRRRAATAHGATPAARPLPVSPGPVPGTGAGALHAIAIIGSPVAAVAALLFYFGWVRATVQARELGYDTSMLDRPPTAYIVDSVDVLVLPLILLIILGLALNLLHQRLVRTLIRRPGRRRTAIRLTSALRLSWLLWLPLGLVLLAQARPVRGFALPTGITLAVLCTIYGRTLQRQIVGKDTATRTAKLLTILLLTFAVFWDTDRMAQTMGKAYAADIVARPNQLVAVSVYSTKDLGLRARGVLTTRLTAPDSRYLFHYTGLRLLDRDGPRYLLITDRWDPREDRLIVLKDTDEIRMEFAHREYHAPPETGSIDDR